MIENNPTYVFIQKLNSVYFVNLTFFMTKNSRISINKVGYTMRDIRYKWNEGPNSVGVSSEVSLPQFKVLGHRQRAMEISLTTGRSQSVDRTSA